jgi:hypothetical protein
MSVISEETYCGGWIVYDKVTAETFVPLREWEKRFAEFETRKSTW